MAAATTEVCSEQFRDTDASFCGCGEAKRPSHQRCKKCRQKASRKAHLQEIRSKDRIRKKVITTQVPRIIPITRADRELSACVAAESAGFSLGGPLPDTTRLRCLPSLPVQPRIKVSSQPQVASALKPWKDGFLPETECELLLEKRTRIIPTYENGVPVDMAQESDEVKQRRDEKAKRQSGVLGELARTEARKRKVKQEQDAARKRRDEALARHEAWARVCAEEAASTTVN